MNLKKIFLVIYISLLPFSFVGAMESAQSEKVFKIGFEFQESSNLCPWAKGNYNVQKKPFFYCLDKNGTKLWSIVLDGADIEFVTEPFTNNQLENLKQAINGIIEVSFFLTPKTKDLNDFKNALSNPKIINLIGKGQFESKLGATLKHSEIPWLSDKEAVFNLWKSWLKTQKQETYGNYGDEQFLTMWNSNLNNSGFINSIFKLSGFDESSPAITVEKWISEGSVALSNKGYRINIPNEDLFSSIKANKITLRTELKFEPQMTLQYPLEHSIPLWFGLFGFEKNSPIFSKFKDITVIFQKDTSYDKYSGLVFLHALTLYSMAPNSLDDTNLLYEINERIARGQADVKGLLYLMSRRPFSNMWKDIQNTNKVFSNYQDLFNKLMESNKCFAGIKENFYKTNYAEEYLGKDNYRVDLTTKNIFTLFNGNAFYKENESIINKLLSNGIISTTMIRNFDQKEMSSFSSILHDYYINSIESVQNPSFPHYRFNVETSSIEEKIDSYDVLSPPHFLDSTDAMGYYKDDNKIDKNFGEAIVEARQIKNAGLAFLKTINLQDRLGQFLTDPNKLLNEVEKTFGFVMGIFTNKNLLEFILESSVQ